MDIAAFYNDYSHLSQSFDADGGVAQTAFTPGFEFGGTSLENIRQTNMHGEAYGVETSVKYAATQDWDLTANYSYYKLNLHGFSSFEEKEEGGTPQNLFNIQSDYRFNDKLSFHSLAYYADSQAEEDVKSYIRVDLGLIYKFNDKVQIAAWGRNLLDPYHPEAHNILTTQNHQVGRSFSFELSIKF